MNLVRASEIPMSERLPRLRAYLNQARRTLADPSTDGRVRSRMRERIARIEADLVAAADREEE